MVGSAGDTLREAVIVSAVRSPIGRANKGSLVTIRPDDLATQIVRAALDNVPELDPRDLDDLVMGCAQPAGESGKNLARVVAVELGYDYLSGTTVNRYCASSVQCTRMAFHAIKAGEGDAFVAAGVETVSRFTRGSADSWPDAAAAMLRVDHAELSRLALAAPPGSDGLVLVPYLQGERTPNRPDATGAVHGLTLRTSTPQHLARAAIEGLLCGLADGVEALVGQGVEIRRIILVGGGARSEALRRIAPTILGHPVLAPPPGEYVADGAALQAAWTLRGDATPPAWGTPGDQPYQADVVPEVRERYAVARDLIIQRASG